MRRTSFWFRSALSPVVLLTLLACGPNGGGPDPDPDPDGGEQNDLPGEWKTVAAIGAPGRVRAR